MVISNRDGVRYLSKGIFLRTTSQVTISSVALSQICNFPSGYVGLPVRRRQSWGLRAVDRTGYGAEHWD